MQPRKVVLTTDISLLITDYQMMSLACNYLGPSANKFCPTFYVSTFNVGIVVLREHDFKQLLIRAVKQRYVILCDFKNWIIFLY